MPVVVFAPSPDALWSPQADRSTRTMIQVSECVADRIEQKVGGRTGVLQLSHIPRLDELASVREFDADLRLLIRKLQEHCQLYVRLL